MEEISHEIIIEAERIKTILAQVAVQIKDAYRHCDEVVVLSVLEGARRFTNGLFATGLLAGDKFSVFGIKASSYHGQTESSGKVDIDWAGTETVISGRDILVVDDVIDTGNTIDAITQKLNALGARTVKNCVMINKTCVDGRKVKADFAGIDLDNIDFLVGFGLDYNNAYRELPYIAAIRPEAVSAAS